MAIEAATNMTSASVASYNVKVGMVQKLKPSGLWMKSTLDFGNFSGLKAAASVSCESDSSFFGKDGVAALHNSFKTRAMRENIQSVTSLEPKVEASFKVAVLGAAGGIGQPLDVLATQSKERR